MDSPGRMDFTWADGITWADGLTLGRRLIWGDGLLWGGRTSSGADGITLGQTECSGATESLWADGSLGPTNG